MDYLCEIRSINLAGRIYSRTHSNHSILIFTLCFADQGDVWRTIRNQGAGETLAGSSESCLRVIWGTRGGEHCELGDVGCIGVLFWSRNLYHFLPGEEI